MFFVSEEFLRKYEEGAEFDQTIGEVVPSGQELFTNTKGKREHNLRIRKETSNKRKNS